MYCPVCDAPILDGDVDSWRPLPVLRLATYAMVVTLIALLIALVAALVLR